MRTDSLFLLLRWDLKILLNVECVQDDWTSFRGSMLKRSQKREFKLYLSIIEDVVFIIWGPILFRRWKILHEKHFRTATTLSITQLFPKVEKPRKKFPNRRCKFWLFMSFHKNNIFLFDNIQANKGKWVFPKLQNQNICIFSATVSCNNKRIAWRKKRVKNGRLKKLILFNIMRLL